VRTAGGDRLAFRLLHRRYEAYVLWLALRMVGWLQDAEDAAQEAWIKVFSRANDSLPEGRVRAWIRTIVVRCCLDHHRRRRRMAGSDDAGTFPEEMAGDFQAPGQRLDLERALQSLPWDLRSVVVLHDVEGMAHGEVGELLRISNEASRSRLSRARKQLRKRLRET
jgi:RNA polymerase sigma-70 factor (ECF subfamily)